ncbi:MAG: ABC transporter permease, partial [Saprospiraceae bacterium]
MLLHYFKLAYRTAWRDKTTFAINLVGLAVGLTCFVLIALWIQDEWRFDKFHQNKDRLFQVMMRSSNNANDVVVTAGTPGLLAETLVEDFPEIEQATTVANLGNTGIIINDDLRFKAKERYVGKDFFELFNFPLVAGEATPLLNNLSHILLSEEMATKLFGNAQNAVNQTIEWQRNWAEVSGNYTIAGVFADVPEHSTLEFDALFSYDLFVKNKPSIKQWYNSGPRTYFSLKESADPLAFNQKIEHLIRSKHDRNSYSTLFIRKFSDRYLYDHFENGIQSGGRITYVKLFALVALFILLIACINFMNLSTAKASQRLKEVAVKKTIGARRSTLIQQYLSQAIFTAFLGLILALFLTQLSIPVFNEITGKNLVFTFSPPLLIGLTLITFITGIIAGSYPAFYLSQFQPIQVFKGAFGNRLNAVWLRKGLVVFQFALSIILIVAVIVTQQQIQFIQTKHLGYEQDNLILFKKEGSIKENMESFLTEIKQIPGIVNASTIDGNMTGSYGYTSTIRWEGDQQQENPI